MRVTPLSTVGAEVDDIDVTRLDVAGAAELAAAWAEHGVLFLRDQELTEDDHIAFAEKFAPIDVNRFFKAHATHARIALVVKDPDQTEAIGAGWHTDHSYDLVPAWGSILVAREVPEVGGDTLFADVAAAFDALSDGLKTTLTRLSAHHSNVHTFGAAALAQREAGDRLGNPEGVGGTDHPVVVVHPVTGRRLLYVNPGFTTHFVGWTPEESAPLLEYLYAHISQDRFTTRFQWAPGSIAMWDNRSTWHAAVNDYDGHRRLMHRITIRGEPLAASSGT